MSAKSTAKTNAARLLDTLSLPYTLLSYAVDLHDLSADSTAAKLGLPPEQVFKTLVASGDRQGICLAVIPGNARLDLKRLAKLSGNRKVDTVPLRQVQPLTGYIRGGVTALACKKPYPVYVDEWMEAYDQIAVSAGQRGLMLWLTPAHYLQASGAKVGALTHDG
ncbi:MAG: Cys-tRNA(Pro) deacylase [Cyanobacteria bacterium J06628_6]